MLWLCPLKQRFATRLFALQEEVDFEIADFFDRAAGVFLKELVELKAETRVIDDQRAHIQTAFMLHPQEESGRPALVICGFY